MGRFFTRERFGFPQVTAAFLLLLFLGQCIWLLGQRGARFTPEEISRIAIGRRLWEGKSSLAALGSDFLGQEAVSDRAHSPLWYLVAAAPSVAFAKILKKDPHPYLQWLSAMPFVVFGVLLGGSLWYVARRLYGNAGGYTALALYCFSPAIIRSSVLWFAEPETGSAWGAFGAVFTAIAVAHTLYAPREVVLWNWRRIVLLALSFALAVGSEFGLVIVVPVALGFMLYLAPTRRVAAVAIWGAACGLSLLLLFGAYFFHPDWLFLGLRHADYFPILWRAYGMPSAYGRVLWQTASGNAALSVAAPVALIVFAAWRRTRYFGNLAPLLMAILFFLLSVGTPHVGKGFELLIIPFLFVFVSGIAADLLESKYRAPALAGLAGLVVANAIWNVWALVQSGAA